MGGEAPSSWADWQNGLGFAAHPEARLPIIGGDGMLMWGMEALRVRARPGAFKVFSLIYRVIIFLG